MAMLADSSFGILRGYWALSGRVPRDMFELSLYNRGQDGLRKAIRRSLRKQATVGNRAANDTLIKLLGVNVSITRDESYCQEALDYHLGLVHAHVGDIERAARHFALS